MLGSDCKPKVAWQTTLGDATLYPSPTVAGGTVWIGLPVKDLSGVAEALLGVDARTGRVLVRRPIGGVSFAPPSALPGMLFVATMHGYGPVRFPVASRPPGGSALPEYTSRLDAKHAWQSREEGVYSTDDGGRHWRRIYPAYAVRVDRLSTTSGVISVGATAPPCGCATQRLWTVNNGRSWRVARGIGGDFEGSGTALYWWAGGSLYLAGPSFQRSKRLATADGQIVYAAGVPGGVVALVDRRSKAPQVIVAQGADTHLVTLPSGPNADAVRSIAAAGQTVLVTGRDFSSPGTDADPTLTWRSHDGGQTWTLGS